MWSKLDTPLHHSDNAVSFELEYPRIPVILRSRELNLHTIKPHLPKLQSVIPW
ncbi:hypothetical protein FA15DRAFT_663751 [Coprinopsis marcescibilis]|uniref:Uncharacterized protein n=1 Tax=Coprinopsis marcescibilis TaxID=230819 RepID=A0A5C3LAG3_COPMA|nr:hypothetical protein FA15DRAFT_663751 [Coprinopsis marcescibilis]